MSKYTKLYFMPSWGKNVNKSLTESHSQKSNSAIKLNSEWYEREREKTTIRYNL